MYLQWSLGETLRAGETRGPQEGMNLLYSACEVRVPETKSFICLLQTCLDLTEAWRFGKERVRIL